MGIAMDLAGKWLPGRDSLYAFTASCAALLSCCGGGGRGDGLDLLSRLVGAFGVSWDWCRAVQVWLGVHGDAITAAAVVVMIIGLAGMNGFDGYFTRAGASWAVATAVLVEVGQWSWWAAAVLIVARALVAGAVGAARAEAMYVAYTSVMGVLYAPFALASFLVGDLRPTEHGNDQEVATGARVAR